MPLAINKVAAEMPANHVKKRLATISESKCIQRPTMHDNSEHQPEQYDAPSGLDPATCRARDPGSLDRAPGAGIAVSIDGLNAYVPFAGRQLLQAELGLVHGIVHQQLGEVGLLRQLNMVTLPWCAFGPAQYQVATLMLGRACFGCGWIGNQFERHRFGVWTDLALGIAAGHAPEIAAIR